MSRFDECLKFVLAREGGYVNHKNDRGKATNKGITQKTYDAYREKLGLENQSVRGITSDEVSSIYKTGYWNAAKCGVLKEPIDLMTFDASVNHGPGMASKLLQSALGVDVDGKIGPKTIDALQEEFSANRMEELVDNMIAIRLDFYHSIVERDQSQGVFIKGWENRLKELRREALA